MNTTIQKFVYGAFAASLLAACTTEDFYDQAKKERMDYNLDVASEVKISLGAGTVQTVSETEIIANSADFQFGGSGVMSKSAINSNPDTKAFSIKDEKLGVFMLAKGIVPDNDYSDVTWDYVNWANHDTPVTIPNIGEYEDKWSAPVWNHAANVNMYDASGAETTNLADAVTSSVAFVPDQPYYPVGNYCSYNMYGYYPLQATSNMVVEKSKLTVTIPVTGTDDVLWGRASYSQEDVAGTNIKWFTPGEATGVIYDGKEITDFRPYAYSAKFFRFSPFRTSKEEGDEAIAPTMKFKHKMMMLKFDVIAGGTPIDADADKQNYSRAYNTTISSLSVDNAPKSIDLVVADLSGAANEGKVTSSTETTTVSIEGSATPQHDADGKPVRTTLKDANGNDAYVILPTSVAENYHINLTLTDNNETPAVTKVIPVPLSLKTKPESKFEEGKIYRIVFKIWNLEKMQLDATLEAWEEIEPTEENWKKYPFITEGDHTIPVH